MRQSLIKVFLIVVTLFVFVPASAQSKTDIEFILDVSGSMRKVSDGEAQIDSARKALTNAIADIPDGTQVALRVYGHRVEQTNKAESCKDSELVQPFSPINRDQIKTKIATFNPKGYTPISYSLEKAKEDFGVEREADKVIILLSDGEETCGGDPVAVLKKLQEEGFKVVVHTVGFNVDAATRKQLEDISNATSGTYYDAKGSKGLNDALKEATKASLVIEKEKTTYGNEIRGGNSYETAVSIEFDKEYKLDHHQKKNDYDYFSINLSLGQELNIKLQTLEKGVSLYGGNVQENQNPYAAIELHGQERNKIKGINIIGDEHSVKTLIFSPPKEGKYYLLVGSTYADMNKDHVTFTLTSTTRGDLGLDKDSGDTLKSALAMETKRYSENYIGGGDKRDIFSFSAKKGENYFVGIIPNEEMGTYFKIAVFDDYKQKLTSKMSGSNQGIKTDTFQIPNDGTYYVEIELGVLTGKSISYTLELKKVESPQNPK